MRISPFLLFAAACTASLDAYTDMGSTLAPVDTGTSAEDPQDGAPNEDGGDGDDGSVDSGLTKMGELPCTDDVLVDWFDGTTASAGNDAEGSCGGDDGNDVLLAFTAPEAGRWAFALSGTYFDTTLYVRDGCRGRELACADTDDAEVVAVDLEGGQSVVVGVDAAGQGQGVFSVEAFGVPDSEGACANGADDDLDGLVDCDDDDCSDKPACNEDCNDGLDNNADGLIDCADPDCQSRAHCEAPCADDWLTGPLPIRYYGTTAGGGNDTDPSCQTSSDARDRAYAFVAPTTGTYTIDTFGSSWDTVLYVLDECGGREMTCNDDVAGTTESSLTAPLQAGQRIIVVVDGYLSNQGDFQLNIY